MGRPNRGTGSAGPKKPNPPINRPQYGNGGKKEIIIDKKTIYSSNKVHTYHTNGRYVV